jgi:VIT1/CCC1 family predicted Fe2+/Mn2+ transporter
MSNLLYAAALVGLLLLICGATVARLATNPPAAYLGTIGAGIGVVLLAVQSLGRLLGV